MAKNRKLKSNIPISQVHKLLRLCYIIAMLMMMSCVNDKPSQTQNTNETAPQETDDIIQESSKDTKTILCFGDSITAGYGLDDTKDAFPALLQHKIDSLNFDYEVVNSGLSGETTAGGKSRINWVMKQEVDIFILELGANDGLRGLPLSETLANLQTIIDYVKQQSPKTQIVLAGMQLPPNMGQDYITDFKDIYVQIAQANNLSFIPFILKGVGGVEELNQRDGIHPTAEGHQIIANTVWEVLKPLLENGD